MELDSRPRYCCHLTYLSTAVVLALITFAGLLGGCTGIAKGVTEALIGDREETVDTRKCLIRGRPFEGLEASMRRQEQKAVDEGTDRRVLKVLMVHGIGSHQPGYATRLAENLARALDLPQQEERDKEIKLTHPLVPGELGSLRVSRLFNRIRGRELLFYELTWDPIVEKTKQEISFDNSGEYAFRRAGLNNSLKVFVNETIPDVVMYYGEANLPIQLSVGQALCWMLSDSWDSLPGKGQVFCDSSDPENLDRLDDDLAFITHSLGSRITADAIQNISGAARDNPNVRQRLEETSDIRRRLALISQKSIPIFMLSNQLPLLQLGQPAPQVRGQIDQICRDDSLRGDERFFRETRLIAFSDPNDLFSYAIPPKYLDQHVDSRLCPTMTNVILNVASVTKPLGLGEIASPMSAHTDYDNDERVIGLIVHGIGYEDVAPVVADRCEWIESVPAQK